MTTPIKPTKQTPSNATPSPAQVASYSHFNMTSIAALHLSTFAEGFSNNERQAAARALLRHDVHIDGTHYQTRTPQGLHPFYIAFNPPVKQVDKRTLTQDDLLEAGLQDIFDAVNLQDRLDGGISLIIRCAGMAAGPKFTAEKIPLDIYITPRELQATPEHIGGDVAVWAQVFAQEFAIPHLQRFSQHCAIEKVTPPKCCK
ncbi:hypothetical protein EDB19DRAFT_1646823 [Suillus lakei]|nr:hypothetical protein EDB19DRAFT_1646823 [Suillus lakei]